MLHEQKWEVNVLPLSRASDSGLQPRQITQALANSGKSPVNPNA